MNGINEALKQPADPEQFGKNWDAIFGKKPRKSGKAQTWQAWDKELDTGIIDPDGFRSDAKGTLYTKKQFLAQLDECTRDLSKMAG